MNATPDMTMKKFNAYVRLRDEQMSAIGRRQ